MDLDKALHAVEKLVDAMEGRDLVERLQTYATISRLLDEIESYARDNEEKGEHVGLARLHITEMRDPLASLADIGTYGPDQRQDCIKWVLEGVQKLRSEHAFNLRT